MSSTRCLHSGRRRWATRLESLRRVAGWSFVIRREEDRTFLCSKFPKNAQAGEVRLHLDLYTDNKEVEVDRLVTIGATRYPWRYRPGQRLYRPGRSRQQSFLRGPTSQGLKHGAGIHSCKKGFALPVTCGLDFFDESG